MVVREVTDHHSPLAIEPFTAGMHLPLSTTSAGLAYLAHCPDVLRAALPDEASRSQTQVLGSAHDSADLSRRLAEIVKMGYATSTQSRRLVEEFSISIPVKQADLIAILTVRFAASAVPLQTGLERFLPKLRHCAAKISAAFLQAKAEPPAGTRKGMPRTAA
jgi:DNA-binding IclR family transcriptional regulator